MCQGLLKNTMMRQQIPIQPTGIRIALTNPESRPYEQLSEIKWEVRSCVLAKKKAWRIIS